MTNSDSDRPRASYSCAGDELLLFDAEYSGANDSASRDRQANPEDEDDCSDARTERADQNDDYD